MIVLVTYDITDDRRREDVAVLLSGYGPRVQLSVFECECRDSDELRDLRARLRDIIDPLEDQISLAGRSSQQATRLITEANAEWARRQGREVEFEVPAMITRPVHGRREVRRRLDIVCDRGEDLPPDRHRGRQGEQEVVASEAGRRGRGRELGDLGSMEGTTPHRRPRAGGFGRHNAHDLLRYSDRSIMDRRTDTTRRDERGLINSRRKPSPPSSVSRGFGFARASGWSSPC
ncbi:CRISPR-associated endonuclease Cas2 [Nocardia farcinica]|uniref:CRISPR-associated endonuclease Cas2 n=1 Tax=Nocardia farcinica TaxID=37329 RepID=UPI001E2D9060|nr:CRISPR-associated endonuclease Cas2 [Nocardia farcinica]